MHNDVDKREWQDPLSLRLVVSLLGLALSASTAASQTTITVTNPGFESDSLAPVGWTVNTFAAGWTCTPGANPGVDICGAFRPGSAQFSGGVPDGVNTAYSNGGTITQQLTASLATARYTHSE